MPLPFHAPVNVSLSADSLETAKLSYLAEVPVSPSEAELRSPLRTAALTCRGTPWVPCRSRCLGCIMLLSVVGPQRGIISSWNAVTQCFKLCSKQQFLWFTLCCPCVLILSVTQGIIWWLLLLYFIYIKLFAVCVSWMYESALSEEHRSNWLQSTQEDFYEKVSTKEVGMKF